MLQVIIHGYDVVSGGQFQAAQGRPELTDMVEEVDSADEIMLSRQFLYRRPGLDIGAVVVDQDQFKGRMGRHHPADPGGQFSQPGPGGVTGDDDRITDRFHGSISMCRYFPNSAVRISYSAEPPSSSR